MTREEAKQLLPIIQAYSDGKTIQTKSKNSPIDKWTDSVVAEGPSFDHLENIDYRIKPEPRTVWVVRGIDKIAINCFDFEQAAKDFMGTRKGWTISKYEERL